MLISNVWSFWIVLETENGGSGALGRCPSVEAGDDDVFMALELPLDSRSSTTSSNGTSSSSSVGPVKAMLKAPRPAKPLLGGTDVCRSLPSHNNPPSHLHRISYLNRTRSERHENSRIFFKLINGIPLIIDHSKSNHPFYNCPSRSKMKRISLADPSQRRQ